MLTTIALLVLVFAAGYALGRRDGARAQACKPTNSITTALLIVVGLATAATANDSAAAYQHWASLPPDRQLQARYISTWTAPTALDRHKQSVALAFVVASSTRQDNLAYCRPIEVTPTLRVIYLDWLKWSPDDWNRLVAKYPYHPTGAHNATLVRADWLVLQLTDQTESDAYLRFVFGRVPKNRDDALAILSVDAKPQFRFGLIQANSGVSVSGTRWIENRPISRGYAWGTRDTLQLDGDSDPLERPDGGFKHDGEEWIVGLPKFDPATGYRGALQVYFLANGGGAIVPRAPVDLVRDHREFRGFAEIRNPGSCIDCHDSGLNPVGPNQLTEIIKSGVEAYADYKNYQRIEAFHFSQLDKEVNRNCEDFQGAALLACGEPSAEASLYVKQVVEAYDAPVTLERAAAEVYTEAVELKRALALGSATGYSLGARLSALAHDGTVPREAFEENYLAVRGIAEHWRQPK